MSLTVLSPTFYTAFQEADRLFEAISNFVAQDKKEMSAIKSDHN